MKIKILRTCSDSDSRNGPGCKDENWFPAKLRLLSNLFVSNNSGGIECKRLYDKLTTVNNLRSVNASCAIYLIPLLEIFRTINFTIPKSYKCRTKVNTKTLNIHRNVGLQPQMHDSPMKKSY